MQYEHHLLLAFSLGARITTAKTVPTTTNTIERKATGKKGPVESKILPAIVDPNEAIMAFSTYIE